MAQQAKLFSRMYLQRELFTTPLYLVEFVRWGGEWRYAEMVDFCLDPSRPGVFDVSMTRCDAVRYPLQPMISKETGKFLFSDANTALEFKLRFCGEA